MWDGIDDNSEGPYAETVSALRRQGIEEGAQLRNLPEGSEEYLAIQARVIAIARRREHLIQAIPRLTELDAWIARAVADRARADGDASAMEGWTPAATVMGIIGLAVILIGVAWSLPPWVSGVGAAMIVTALLAVMVGGRRRRRADQTARRVDQHVADLIAERDALLEGATPIRPLAPVESSAGGWAR